MFSDMAKVASRPYINQPNAGGSSSVSRKLSQRALCTPPRPAQPCAIQLCTAQLTASSCKRSLLSLGVGLAGAGINPQGSCASDRSRAVRSSKLADETSAGCARGSLSPWRCANFCGDSALKLCRKTGLFALPGRGKLETSATAGSKVAAFQYESRMQSTLALKHVAT